jgi:RimJ/RimL family protein N-acetyltransferase
LKVYIETKRCALEPFKEVYIDVFMEYRNNEQWMQYQGLKGLTKEEYIEIIVSNTSLEQGLQVALLNRYTKKLLGDVYLKQEDTVLWVGYTVHPLYSRQGYAYEALMGVILWAKEQAIITIKAGVLVDNIASIKLLEKVGFQYVGIEDEEWIYQLTIN